MTGRRYPAVMWITAFMLSSVTARAQEAAPCTTAPRVSGYIQIYYKSRVERSGDRVTEPDVFRFGRVKIQVDGKLSPAVSYVVEIDPRSPQVEGLLRDCYLEWGFHPHQALRAGQMKTPFGWENRTSTADLFTVNRTEVGELFGRGLKLRDIGVGWFGHVPLGRGFRIEHELTVTNGAGLSVQADDDRRKNVFGRLGFRSKRPSATVWLGVSGASGSVNEPIDPGPPPVPGLSIDFNRLGVDAELDTRRALAVVEYARGEENASLPDQGGTLDAWYVLVAGKTRWNGGPVVRYDVFDTDTHRWTIGVYHGLPGAPLRAIVTYEVMSEPDLRHDDRLLVWMQVRF
ncbi:MAG: hypothetical protein HOP12_08865 [Candidatus Eisenbacteria bacterium]|uniref:Lipid A deacylase LpxR family protein n=1 Tax=Eiseniibacteriota bacterium TaxID=2212470 RepID=A0A849SNS8_UNCEI|nr:hypothetical protein [Candidatus Eisenbacteria bacterium]